VRKPHPKRNYAEIFRRFDAQFTRRKHVTRKYLDSESVLGADAAPDFGYEVALRPNRGARRISSINILGTFREANRGGGGVADRRDEQRSSTMREAR